MDKEIKTFEIENLAQITNVIEAIKENFAKPEVEQASVIIRFTEKVSVKDLVESLQKLWQYEVDSNHTIDILIKNLSYEHRKAALKAALATESLKNPIFLSNVFCLIKGSNTFEEAYFNHEQVFLNDEVEYLDIFDDLEDELKPVNYKLAEYYVSMLKTCNLLDSIENNPNTIKIEPLYEYLFSALDVTILAKILSSVKDPSIWETKKIVFNSLGYLGMIAEKFVFTNTILELFGSTLLKHQVEAIVDKQE